MLERTRKGQARGWTLGAMMAAAVFGGCERADVSSPATASATAGADREAPKRDIWEALYLEKAKIGYIHTTVRDVEREGRKLVQFDSHNHLNLKRFGQTTVQDFRMSTLETPDGQLISFTTDAAMGAAPVRTTGHVEGSEMIITAGMGGPTRIPWSSEFLGFRGLERSLEEQPMTPGQERSLRVLAPLLDVVTQVDLKAADYEMTDVLGTSVELLRIDTVTRLADGNSIDETLWIDRSGEIIKRRISSMRQELFRTTRGLAMADGPSGSAFDLGTDTIVKLERPIPDAHRTRIARYRVELAGADPAKVFATGPTQSLRSLEPRVAELTVRAASAAEPGSPGASVEGPKPEYTTANNILQIDDSAIQAMASEAKGGASEPREVALALERYVHRVVATKDFSQTFATAAEVARTRQGDCTEHAVLLAALARACDIPSRVAIGLVYVPRSQGFGYHMWTEVYVDGRWLPLDATLGQGGIGAAHIKLTDSSLEGAGAFSTFLPVAQVVGQLKIGMLDVE